MATSAAASAVMNANARFVPNVMGVSIDPKTAFPDQYSELVGLKQEISQLSVKVQEAEQSAKNAANAVKGIGALNAGNASFRGKNGPSVYAAYNNASNDYVARGNFSINGFPFRAQNTNSFNGVLAQMKEMRGTVGQTLRNARAASTNAKALQTQLQTLDTQLKMKTAKLRKNIANASAKASRAQRKGIRQVTGPSYTVKPGVGSVSALNTALMPPQPPKKSFLSRMFGRKTRRNNRK